MAPPIKREWKAVAKFAREHPGEWCLVSDDQPISQPQHIRNARLRAFAPAGAYEGMIRGGNGLRGRLLIRYTQKESE
jgi:hypothetical protein